MAFTLDERRFGECMLGTRTVQQHFANVPALSINTCTNAPHHSTIIMDTISLSKSEFNVDDLPEFEEAEISEIAPETIANNAKLAAKYVYSSAQFAP